MKILKYIAAACTLIGFVGCQKLDRDFQTTISREQLEQSFGNVKGLLTAIYSDLPDGMQYIGTSAMMASASDEAEFTSETNAVQAFNTGSWNAINNPDYIWDKYYRDIRRVDQFLLSTDKINLNQYKLDPSASAQQVYTSNLAEIRRWKYEARFLRAFYYFELVKRYGGIPLINQALTLEEDFSKTKRNSLNDCINFITNECDSAALELPLTGSTAPYIVGNDLGRATKLSALALKSRVLLYAASDLFNTTTWAGGYANPEYISLPAGDRMLRWKAAADAAKACIDASPAVTLGAYKSLFNTFNNAEIIMSRINWVGGNNTNDFEKYNSPIGFPSGQSGNTPSQDMVDAYEVKVNATTAVKFDWNDPVMAASPYSNRDPRLGFSVTVNNASFGTPARAVETFTGGKDAKPIPNATKTGYYLRKYLNESLNISSGNTASHSWIFFRFPEMYLNYAEALNEYSPGNADIKKYVDLVRTRGGVAMPPMPSGLSQTAAKDVIRNERRVELAFEDHRFWDVRRWMVAPATLGVPLRGVDVTKNATTGVFTYSPFTVENRVFQPKMYLYPIPQTEINISPLLVQNPQW